MTANSSWEEGWEHWGRSNVPYHTTYSGGVDGSDRYGMFKSSGYSSRVYSTTRVYDIADNDIEGWKVKGRANYRKWASSNTGNVRVTVMYRPVNYAGGSSAGCNFAFDNLNDEEGTGYWVSKSIYCGPQGGWGYCTTSPFTLDKDAQSTFGDAVDIRINLYNRMKTSSGSWTYVRTDRTRAMLDQGEATR